MDEVERLLSGIEDLPTLPAVALRIWELEQGGDYTLSALSREISLDFALAARVLRLANSVLYGGSRRLETVDTAVLRLGTRRTLEVVLTSALLDIFPSSAGFDHTRFWSFGLGSAIAARQLAIDVGYDLYDRAYLAGLVHLIGEAVLGIYFPERYGNAAKLAASGETDLFSALAKEFGVEHPTLAAHVLRRWRFPEGIVTAVELHRQPETAGRDPLLAGIVFAADRLARAADLGPGDEPVDREAWANECPSTLEIRLRAQGIAGLEPYLAQGSDLLEKVAELAREMFPPQTTSRATRPPRAH